MEFKEAEANLEKAIQDMVSISQQEGPGILVDWVLITAEHYDFGESRTSTAYGLYGPKNQRLHHGIGLVRHAIRRLEKKV